MKIISGIDLPSHPEAFSKLLSDSYKNKTSVNIIIQKNQVYHPKVYITKTGNSFTAFIGSANFTAGGLSNNFEMTFQTSNKKICCDLLEWFEKELLTKSKPLTQRFINTYSAQYQQRLSAEKINRKAVSKIKNDIEEDLQSSLKKRSLLIRNLKKIRRSPSYELYKVKRRETIKELKDYLDYPNFKKIDLKAFFGVKTLGTIVAIKVKGQIQKNPQKFSALMKFLCNDKIPIDVRLNEALTGELAIKSVGIGFLSKVLVIHDPQNYFVYNKEFEEIFKPLGLSLPRGLDFGKKYELILNILESVRKEAGINNFATLDECLLDLKSKTN